eukprot:scaffold58307_cov58-Attheya_sp.AAC.3
MAANIPIGPTDVQFDGHSLNAQTKDNPVIFVTEFVYYLIRRYFPQLCAPFDFEHILGVKDSSCTDSIHISSAFELERNEPAVSRRGCRPVLKEVLTTEVDGNNHISKTVVVEIHSCQASCSEGWLYSVLV